VQSDYNNDGRGNNRGGRGRGRGYGGNDHRGSSNHSGGHNGGEKRGFPLSELDPKITEASRKVIGASIEVHRAMGPGYPVDVYIEALKIELQGLGMSFQHNHRLNVMYRGQRVGEVTACLFVDGLFLVTVMGDARAIDTADRMQLRAQLKAANLDLGLIINFAEKRVTDGLVRVLNIDKINADRGITGQHDHHDGEVSDPDVGGSQVHDFDPR
jgi:GxxExxY protein